MKTKTIFILCLLIGIATVQVYSQPDNKKQNGAVSTWVEDFDFYTPVICNGVFTDYIGGILTMHYVDHWVNGVWQSFDRHISGEATGLTDEVFKFSANNKFYFTSDPQIFTWHCNLKGDQGNHYIMDFTIENGKFTIDKAVCLENGKK
jgi:hypothetical protein